MADGYRYQHGDQLMACEACGALVDQDGTTIHDAWHAWHAQLVDDIRYHLAQSQPPEPDKALSGAGQGPGIGWWVISGDNLLAMLQRVHAGENPDLVYAEEYANSEHHHQPPHER